MFNLFQSDFQWFWRQIFFTIFGQNKEISDHSVTWLHVETSSESRFGYSIHTMLSMLVDTLADSIALLQIGPRFSQNWRHIQYDSLQTRGSFPFYKMVYLTHFLWFLGSFYRYQLCDVVFWFVRYLSGTCQADVGQSSGSQGSHRAVIRESPDSHQAVKRQSCHHQAVHRQS